MHDPQQTKPWYREPWPWILMSGPAAAVLGGIVTAFIAIAHDDPLVVDNYYKEGLAINRVLERDRAAARAGYRAQVMFADDRTRVRVHLAGERDGLPAALTLRLIHPTRAEMDRTATLTSVQQGWYEGALELGRSPRWRIALEAQGREWRLTGEWQAADGSVAVLSPRS